MITSDGPAPMNLDLGSSLPSSGEGALPSAGDATSLAMAKEIERLANQFFQGAPGPALGGGLSVPAKAVSSLGGDPQVIAPPRVGPHALNVGAGGASPLTTLPPIPGPMHRPPLAATPPPKESDFRAIPAVAAENLGTPTVIELASLSSSDSGTPYFLELAGLPGASPSNAARVPSLPSAAIPSSGIPTTPTVPNSPSMPGAPSVPATHAAAPSSSYASGGVPTSLDYDFRPEVVPDLSAKRGIFDAASVKRDFPILRERVNGRPIVWLDNAATTQKPQSVIDRISYFYEHENSNVHRAAHTLAARSSDAYEAARDKVRRFLNAPSPKQIVFARGATEAINLVAQSYGRRNVREGDEIVITWLEHHANIVPWQQLCSGKGARLRVAPVDSRGSVILEEYEKLLGPKTRIVSLTQVSNALGTITPAREMVAMAHRHGARVLVDGAQAVSHMPVDVQDLDCDFYVFSGHKVFGPTGIGALFGKEDVLEAMPPWQGGGNMIADVTFEKTVYQPAPFRFEAGTGNIADAVGLGAALDYVTGLGLENIRRYEHELLCYGEAQLRRVPGLKLVADPPEKAGVLSFTLDGVRTEDVSAMLDQDGIAVRSGHHCAQPILRRFGLESSVRASLAPYNTCEDIDALVAALLRIQSGRPPRGL